MKNMPLLKICLLVFFLFPAACTKNFEDINTNPNAPEKIPATDLLLSGISNGFYEALGLYYGAFGAYSVLPAGYWAQHFSETVNIYGWDIYQYSLTVLEGQWRQMYTGPLADLQTIIEDPDNGPNMCAAATVMRAYLLSIQADLYGDIPYAQANQVIRYVQPVYDTQEAIYKNLTNQLKQAAAEFVPGADDLGRGDVLYEGDILKWKKLANTLRARLLNRYKHLDNQARQDLIALLNDPVTYPVFESNDDNASLTPVGILPYTAPFYQFNVYAPYYIAPSSTFVDILKNSDDPRLSVFFDPDANGEYVGVVNGSAFDPGGVIPLNERSTFSAVFLSNPTLPMSILIYPELLFIKAEVFDNKQAYLDGIAAAMAMYGTAPTPESTLAAETAWQANHQEAIGTQRWIALLLNENEAYTEFRRTGYPATIQEVHNVKPSFKGFGVPHRYGYPLIEEATNNANLSAARARQHIPAGQEIYGDKMWWAK